jgi:hypothetical protein
MSGPSSSGSSGAGHPPSDVTAAVGRRTLIASEPPRPQPGRPGSVHYWPTHGPRRYTTSEPPIRISAQISSRQAAKPEVSGTGQTEPMIVSQLRSLPCAGLRRHHKHHKPARTPLCTPARLWLRPSAQDASMSTPGLPAGCIPIGATHTSRPSPRHSLKRNAGLFQ